MAILNNSNAISAGGYDINNSLRFRASASAYLSRTFVTGSGTTSTFSAWVKRGTLGSVSPIMFVSPNGTEDAGLQFDGNNNLTFSSWNGAGGRPLGQLITTQVFRDPSAWYHIVLVIDTTQATSSNRLKLYVNGNQVTAFGTATYPSQNATHYWNLAYEHRLCRYAAAAGTNYLDGYLAEVNFIDGSAKTPSDFGETDTTTGVWKPKAYTGTYGTNGFYLKFSDIATTSGSNAGLGKDFSGNGNYWTTNNISVTAGTTYDAMTDVPTNTSATVANYCVLNHNDKLGVTVADGNLKATYSASGYTVRGSMQFPSTGKWYYEMTQSGSGDNFVGLATTNSTISTLNGASGDFYAYYSGGYKYTAGAATSYGATFTNNDVIGVAVDADAGTVVFYKNNTSQGTAFTGLNFATSVWLPLIRASGSGVSAICNFGQRPFTYTPPTGYVALNTYNLPTPTILQGNKYMDATLYTGNGTSQTITNAAVFKPDLFWVKGRSYADFHVLEDTVRGVTQSLSSNLTNAEVTRSTAITAFTSTGFTVGSDTLVNYNGNTLVAWQWQAGQGSTSSNTSGSITSTVSVSTTAGFSIVTYTATNTTGTIGHGLGVAPKMIIVKDRQDVSNWYVYHTSIGATNRLYLNTTAASASDSAAWNNTSPTSTVFSVGTNTNYLTHTHVAYCWAEIAGFSKFGSYTGNGSADGPFVFTNLKPRFIMIKRTDTTSNWTILDTAREGYNVDNDPLYPNLSDAEGTTDLADILSNGFKLRSTDASVNANTGTYIYACFASNPFRNSNAT